MIGAIVGAVGGLAGSIMGGINAKNAAKKAQRVLDDKEKQNEDWYRKKANADYTQSADAQAALSKGRELMQQGINTAAGTQAVMGGSDAAVAQAKQAANNAIADATSKIAVNGAARKDAAESAYLANKDKIQNQRMDIYNQQASNNSAAASAAMQAGMSLAEADAKAHIETGKGLFKNMFGV